MLLLCGCGTPEEESWLGYVESEPALIAPPQAGWLTSLAVERGAEVQQGQKLFTLDAAREVAAREATAATIGTAEANEAEARAAIAAADAQRAEADALITRAQREFERQQGLVRIGASPRRDLEQAEAELQRARAARRAVDARRGQAEAQIAQARAQQQQAKANLEGADVNLSERTVEARVS